VVAIGFGVLWLGYLQGVYGYCLLKGYDIRWRDLANPLNPYQWPPPGQSPPLIPKGQLMPGSPPAAAAAAGSAPQQPATKMV
jgi:hypothetical protein